MLITRRTFVGGAAGALLPTVLPVPLFLPIRPFLPIPPVPSIPPTGDLRVDGPTLRSRLEQLSVFGRPTGGTFADGVSRVAYSDADVRGRELVIGLMKAAGLAPRIDPAGNIFGSRAGTDAGLPPILGWPFPACDKGRDCSRRSAA